MPDVLSTARAFHVVLAALVTAFVSVASTPLAAAQGAAQPASREHGVTFTKDVAPILQRSCQKCHRRGSIGPMPLTTYEEVRPWSQAIKRRVASREMPPWFIDRTIGIQHFKDDPSLSNDEVLTIVRWVDQGAPRGNPADLPPPVQLPDEKDRWHIGTPDLVVTMPVAHVVPADGADWWGYYMADLPLTEDRYIKAIEMKPGNARVVHHGNSWIVMDGEPENLGTPLEQYSVGKYGDIYPDGTGKLLRAGGRISFHMHYHSVGEAIHDRTSVGFVFYPKGYVPTHVIRSEAMANFADLDISAGDDNARFDAYTKLARPARFLAYGPHMHNRGKRNCVELIYPDMRREMLNCLSRYDFAWQILYAYAPEVTPLVPAGTIVHSISWYDNSAGNKDNPDPKNWVGYGQRSNDEMNLVYIDLVYLTDDEFKAAVEQRQRQKARAPSTAQQP